MFSYLLAKIFMMFITPAEFEPDEPESPNPEPVSERKSELSNGHESTLAPNGPLKAPAITISVWDSPDENNKYIINAELLISPPSITVTNESQCMVSLYPIDHTRLYKYVIHNGFGTKTEFLYDMVNTLPVVDLYKLNLEKGPSPALHKCLPAFGLSEFNETIAPSKTWHRVLITDENGHSKFADMETSAAVLPTIVIIDAFGSREELRMSTKNTMNFEREIPPVNTSYLTVPDADRFSGLRETKVDITRTNVIDSKVIHNEYTTTAREDIVSKVQTQGNSLKEGVTSGTQKSSEKGEVNSKYDENEGVDSKWGENGQVDSYSDKEIAAELRKRFGAGSLWDDDSE